jgi:hypothetical protein
MRLVSFGREYVKNQWFAELQSRAEGWDQACRA